MALLLTGLGALTLATTFNSSSIRLESSENVSNKAITLPALPGASDTAAYAPVTDRTIFTADRKDPVDDAAFSSTSNSPFSLVGVIVTNDRKWATVRHASDHEATTLSIGQAIDGWTVVNIKTNAVFLQSGSSKQVLRLADEKDAATKDK
jgi:hypothetical protein